MFNKLNALKTKPTHLPFLLFLFFTFISGIAWGQTDLVRWDLTANENVSYSDPSVTADNLNTSENPISYNTSGALITGWGNTNVEHYRYVGIALSSANGSPVNVGNLIFEHEATTNPPANYTIRYYIAPNNSAIDDYQFMYTLSSVLVNNESISANPVKSIPLNLTISGTQKLIIRFYTSANDYNNAGWRIKANTLKITAPASPLVIWNNTTTNFPPTLVNSNVTASNITTSGVTIAQTGTGADARFETTNWSGSIDTKYIEFTISPNAGYKINLDKFNFDINRGGNGNNNQYAFEVRYSKNNNFTPYQTPISASQISEIWTSQSANISSVNPVMPGETVKIRIYASTNNTNRLINIRRLLNTGTPNDFSHTPQITGVVTALLPPVAVNDNASISQNTATNINILANDTPNGTLNAITITQQPTHGTVTVNGVSDVTYTPSSGYTGTDSFKYKLTNGDGTSNEATVSLNVIFSPTGTDLVQWGNTNLTPTVVASHLSASNLTNSSANSGISGHTADCGFEFRINEENAGTYNVGRYFQFSVTPDAGYNIDLNQYVFKYFRNDVTADNVRIRYSKQADFSSGVQELNATNLALGEHTLTLNFPANTVVNAGETMYFRFHIYGVEDNNWWAKLCIRNNGSDSQDLGPRLIGHVFSNTSTDLQITKTVSNASPTVLSNVVFTLTAKNNGPNNMTGVVVNDPLPAGFAHVSDSGAGAYNPNTGIWNIGALANGTSKILTITAKVIDTENRTVNDYTNKATILGDGSDSNPGNNEANAVVTPYFPQADLAITGLTIDNANPTVGNNVTFTINLINNGTDNALGVAVDALLPSGYQYVSSTPPTGTFYNGSTGIWTIGSLAVGVPKSMTITAKVLATGNYAFNVEISGAVEDIVTGNNTGSKTIDNIVDLAITKTANSLTPNIGGTVIFTINVQNIGSKNATGVVVKDVIPSGYDYVSNNGGATYDAATRTVTRTIGNLAASGTSSFTITTTARAGGVHKNIATVTANEGDTNATNNTASASVTPNVLNAVDLKVVQSVNNETPALNSNVTFTITASNNGPLSATGVNVKTLLANGLQFLSATPSAGTTYNASTGVWTIGNMANAATATLSIQAKVLDAIGAAYLSIAEITGNEAAYDNIITNNRGYSILSPINQKFNPCDVNAEEPAFFDDFGSGASPYAPELEQGRTNMQYASGINIEDGLYTVAKNAQLGYDNWQDIKDPSGDPDGYFMIVNADIDPYEFFRTRITLSEEFCTNTRYNINLKVVNVNSQENYDYCAPGPPEYPAGYIEPEIGYFVINDKGEVLGAGTSGKIPFNAVAEWLEKEFVFVSGQDDEWVELVLFNKAPGGCGNDLAIDDISVYACMTPPIRLDMIIDTTEEEVCGGEKVTMTVINTPDPNIENDNYQWPPEAWGGENGIVEYQWQRSDDGINFTDIVGETTGTYVIESFHEEDQAYYRLMYAQNGNIDKVFCRFPSAQYYPVFNATPVIPPIEIVGDVNYICGDGVPGGTLQLYTNYDTSAYVDDEGESTWGTDFYEWHSSDENVAKIDQNGIVTAEDIGTTTITYTVWSPKGSCESSVTKDISVLTNCPTCVEEPTAPDTGGDPSPIGISTLESQLAGWPENIPNGFIVLESKEKGFVITRVANTSTVTITEPKEGMLVYSVADKCIKLYNGNEWNCIEQECDEVP